MALTYNKNIRDLSIKGTITLSTGRQIPLTTNDIVSYSFDSQIGSEGLPLGSAEAATFSLEIVNENRKYNPAQFDNAEVHMFVGIKNGTDYKYSDFGVWYVESSSAPEQSVSIFLSGYDALATRFEAIFEDDSSVYPTTIGDIAETVCLAAGIRIKSTSFPNAAITVPKMPTWGEDTTLRDILSYCAICAGGYVRIARNGQLEIVGFADGNTYEMGPDLYQTFTLTGGTAFKFNAIEAMLAEDAEDYSRFAINSNVVSNATNTIQLEYNPLLTNSIVQSIVTELSGIEMDAGTITWGGDPSVECTDFYRITTLDGTVHKIMVTSQSFTFDGGMSVSESCDLPAINSNNSPTYSTSTNMYDAKGNLKATRISGLNKEVIKAATGHFNNLTSETIETDQLTAALLNAVDLKAKNIDASSVETDQLTALIANIVSATIKKLEAGTIKSNELYAAFAELITLKAKSITAGTVLTDEFAAEFAKITVLTAGSAAFDRATIQHLVAQAMNLEYGVAGQVFIKNLAVEYAQMVGAAIGELCIKASDGNYYLMDVNSDGTVTATKTTVSNGEITAGETSSGKVILETNITAANLNTGNLLATYALINQIDAARIDVDQLFAREAFVDLLRTSKIVGEKSIQMLVGETDNLNRMSNIEMIDGTFAQAKRRAGEGIHVFSEIGPKQDLKWGAPYPGGTGKNMLSLLNGENATYSQVTPTVSDNAVNLQITDNPSGSFQQWYAYFPIPETARGKDVSFSINAFTKNFETGNTTVIAEQFNSNKAAISGAPYINFFGITSAPVSKSMLLNSSCAYIRIIFRADQGGAAPVGGRVWFGDIQLELGSTATAFAPYANTPAIEGWTGLNAVGCGKNLVEKIVYGYIAGGSTEPNFNADNDSVSAIVRVVKGQRYKISCAVPLDRLRVAMTETTELAAQQKLTNAKDFSVSELTFTAEFTGIAVVYLKSSKDESAKDSLQIEIGSVASDFQPYEGNTYALQFGETIYGGSVDWHAGEMRITWKGMQLLPARVTSSMKYVPGYVGAWMDEVLGNDHAEGQETVLCSHLLGRYVYDWNRDGVYVQGGNTIGIQFNGASIPGYTDTGNADQNAALVRAYLEANEVWIAWKLAEPYTMQLTPAQIASLEGINTVYTDADGGRVEFGHDLLEVTDSAMEPLSPKSGALWLDRGLTPAVLRRYNGSEWETVNDVTLIETVQDALLTKQAELEAAQRETALFLKLDSTNKMVRIGQTGVTSEYRIDAFGSGVVVNNEIFSRFEANRAVFGNMEMRRPAVGGLAFDSIV